MLGPMVYGVCWWPIEYEESKPSNVAKFVDSKTTKAKEREALYKAMNEAPIGFRAYSLSPVMISNEMQAGIRNLN